MIMKLSEQQICQQHWSKALDCLSHDLLIAKQHSYGLSLISLGLLNDYLSNYKQQIKVENFFSKWENIETGVP